MTASYPISAESLAMLADAATSPAPIANQALRLMVAAATANQGLIDDARPEFDAVLKEASDVRLLFVGFQFFFRTKDVERAELLVRKRLAILEQAGETPAVARACTNLGIVLLARKQTDEARTHLERAVRISRTSGDLLGLARDLGHLANYHEEINQLDEAVSLNQEALSLASSHGFEDIAATRLANLGDIARTRGNTAEARRLWTEAAEKFNALGMRKYADEMNAKLDGLAPDPGE